MGQFAGPIPVPRGPVRAAGGARLASHWHLRSSAANITVPWLLSEIAPRMTRQGRADLSARRPGDGVVSESAPDSRLSRISTRWTLVFQAHRERKDAAA